MEEIFLVSFADLKDTFAMGAKNDAIGNHPAFFPCFCLPDPGLMS